MADEAMLSNRMVTVTCKVDTWIGMRSSVKLTSSVHFESSSKWQIRHGFWYLFLLLITHWSINNFKASPTITLRLLMLYAMTEILIIAWWKAPLSQLAPQDPYAWTHWASWQISPWGLVSLGKDCNSTFPLDWPNIGLLEWSGSKEERNWHFYWCIKNEKIQVNEIDTLGTIKKLRQR